MSTTTTVPGGERASALSSRLAAGRLGVAEIVAFTLTAATPLTVIGGVVTTGIAMTGRISMALPFVLIGLALGLWAVGYVAMARRITNSGAFYAFISHGLSKPVGVGAALVALVAYAALTVGLYGLIGIAAPPLIEQFTGVSVPWWAAALACWALVSLLGSRAVTINGRLLVALVALEIVIIAVATAANFAHPAGGELSLTAINPVELATPGAGAVLALAVLGFVGVEAATVYAEECKDRRRTVPRATAWSIAILAVLYTTASWAMAAAVGDEQIVDRARTEGIDLFFNLVGEHFGHTAATVGYSLLVTSVIAAAISFHNTTARYIFALGREHVLPAGLGRTAPRTGAPVAASLTLSGIGLAVIVLYAGLGLDPLVHLFYFGGTSGALGILLLITATSLAVVRYFSGQDGPAWSQRIAPAVAVVFLGIVAGLALFHFDALLGTEPGSVLPVVIPAGFAAVAVVGIVWGLVLRRWRPAVYERIGAGADAALIDPAHTTGGR